MVEIASDRVERARGVSGRHLGFRTLSVTRRDLSHDSLRQAGTDAVVVFDPARDSSETFQKQVRAATHNESLRFAVDAVGEVGVSGRASGVIGGASDITGRARRGHVRCSYSATPRSAAPRTPALSHNLNMGSIERG